MDEVDPNSFLLEPVAEPITIFIYFFFNNDPANLRQTFSSTSKSVQFNWAGRGFLIYRFNFLATLVPYCSTVYVYALFFSNNKNNLGIYLLLR